MDGYTPIRNGILEHLQQGKLTPLEFSIYMLIHLRADWATGIYRGCALTLAYQFGNPGLQVQIKDALLRLKRKRYLNYSPDKGRKGGYEILIHKYEPREGRLIGTRLNAWKYEDKAAPEYEPLASDSPDARLRVAGDSPEGRTIQEVRSKNEESKARFIRPTIEEVKAYCQERANGIDAERFIDHYTANGWKVGPSSMKDWRATVRTWEKRDANNRGPVPSPNRFAGKTPMEMAREEAEEMGAKYKSRSSNRAEQRQAEILAAREQARADLMGN
jgi:hypothetical protein